MKVIGLTGGIASGKSTVARLLRERGIPVLDADQAARAVVAPGAPALAQIVASFGPEVLDTQGALDRPAMRARIIEDPGARRTLEAITHPAIFAHLREALAELHAQGHRVAVVEAALMVETGSYKLYDEVWVVSSDPVTQLMRLQARDGMEEAQARALIAAQLPLAQKEAIADAILWNHGDLEALRAQVDRIAPKAGAQ
ncbi:MAG: dephospho-CoA kinase [Deltaproteobacteria bacterium]|nr:MAG: dephospho-CoA kinase [Deltaproteobacteria bacterium]